MSRIITFYSYKGGVGRTFALANVAVLLANRGNRVLILDCDLEAPGLHRYFRPYLETRGTLSRGMIHLLRDASERPDTDWTQFVEQVSLPAGRTLSMLYSGVDSPDYVKQVEVFSWPRFFEQCSGGSTLERWREQWKKDFDFVLIDSRTGITDTGGVCTILLPDVVVLVFSANFQSFEQGKQVALGIQESRKDLAIPRAPIALLPVPGRFDGRDEVDEARVWMQRFATELQEFYDFWLPKQCNPRQILELTKIPYVAKFSFGEPLPVLTHGITDPDGPGYYLNNVTRLLATDFADALGIVSGDKWSDPKSFDVFISYDVQDRTGALELVNELENRYGLKCWVDTRQMQPGVPIGILIDEGIRSSRSFVVCVGPAGAGFLDRTDFAEIARFARIDNCPVIPVLLPGAPGAVEFPKLLTGRSIVDLRVGIADEGLGRLVWGITGTKPATSAQMKEAVGESRAAARADIRLAPPGLRPFGERDHEAFLNLVPGPRDSTGMPGVIARWKGLIEETDPSRTFRVAHWFGPSGCGKSSLVKAGLIPALPVAVIPIHINSLLEGTEGRVLGELRKVVDRLPADLDLPAAFQWIAQHPDALAGRKLLLVLDQFEQWLYAAHGQLEGTLAAALRHCDGRQLQAMLLVRDEFKVHVHRFMVLLGCAEQNGLTFEVIDLLDPESAKRALFEYGRAYRHASGEWPEKRTELKLDQRQFLEEVIEELQTEDARIVAIQLALVAEMLNTMPWTLQTLRMIGGVRSIGTRFLEQKFDNRAASGLARVHRVAAIKVLTTLLPVGGSNIKSGVRSRDELLEVSGYAQRPSDFSELITLLDSELRIITPVEDGAGTGYQLTHDYLVPSLRDWLTRKQWETRRGRAELMLAERTALWQVRPENRQLPSTWEYLMAVWLVPARNRTMLQQKMLRKAGRFHLVRWGSAFIVLVLIGFVIWKAIAT